MRDRGRFVRKKHLLKFMLMIIKLPQSFRPIAPVISSKIPTHTHAHLDYILHDQSYVYVRDFGAAALYP